VAFASAGMGLFPGKQLQHAQVGAADWTVNKPGWIACVGLGRLGLGAARPIKPLIEADDDRVEIGADADRGNGVEIVVLAAEVVEVILDLAGEIFY